MSAMLGLQPSAVEPRRPANSQGLAVVPRQKSFIAQLIESAEKHNTELPAVEIAPSTPAVLKTKTYPMPLGARLAVSAIQWFKKNRTFAAGKQLRVSDTVSLGEKRFIAVAHIEGKKFLIGGGASGVSLLTQLDSSEQTLQAHAGSGPAE